MSLSAQFGRNFECNSVACCRHTRSPN